MPPTHSYASILQLYGPGRLNGEIETAKMREEERKVKVDGEEREKW